MVDGSSLPAGLCKDSYSLFGPLFSEGSVQVQDGLWTSFSGLGESTPICFFWQQVTNAAQVEVYLDGPKSRNIHTDGPQKESWHIKLNGLRFVCRLHPDEARCTFPRKKQRTHTQNVCCSLLFWYLNCSFVLFLFQVKFCPTSIKFIQKNVLTIHHHISLIKSPIKMHLFHIVDDNAFSQASQSLDVWLRTKLKWPIFIKFANMALY
jgi:hypothetical protein